MGKAFKELFEHIETLGNDKKVEFCECILFQLVIANRGVWGDINYTDAEKVECLKWSNELSQRIWNHVYSLRANEEGAEIKKVEESILSVLQNCPTLESHLQFVIEVVLRRASFDE